MHNRKPLEFDNGERVVVVGMGFLWTDDIMKYLLNGVI